MARRGGGAVATILFALVAVSVAVASRPPLEEVAVVRASAALVLSGDVDYLRVKHASALYRGGMVKALLLTGQGVGGDSAVELRKIAVGEGVPDEAIVLETASTTTRENFVFAAPHVKAHGWRRIALVTSQSHVARAIAAARQVMPEVEWIPAPVPDAGPPSRARRLAVEEALKRLWYKVRGWA